MKASDAWRIGPLLFPWCQNCKRKPGTRKDPHHRECGHGAPVVEIIKDVAGEKQEKCHCVNPDTSKLRAAMNAPPQGAQQEMFETDA